MKQNISVVWPSKIILKTILIVQTFSFFLASEKSMAVPSRVLIIRHAEKPLDPNDPNLSPQGYLRANLMKQLFAVHPAYASKGYPAAVFAAKYIVGKNSNRSIETVTPLATMLGLPLLAPYVGSDAALMGDFILRSPALNAKVVFIAWVHGNIPSLAAALRGHCPSVWDGDQVFDRVWLIDYSNQGSQCYDLPQSLLPNDSP